MSRQDPESLWVAIGGLGAMTLGVALIPLRTVTTASNLAFAFLVLTIVVAEVGGRAAGLATAVVSALSLNFFLTEPYLTLTIHRSDDIVAFLALAVSGLIAAAFGRRREHWSEVAGRATDELDVLKTLTEHLGNAPLEETLEYVRKSFGLRAIAVRSDAEGIVATAPAGAARPSTATIPIDRDTLLPSHEPQVRFGERGLRLPPGGGSVRLRGQTGAVWLDVWEGDERGLDAYQSRALAVALSMLEQELSRRRAG
jgi:K+-sensing histidine kinase KdpD